MLLVLEVIFVQNSYTWLGWALKLYAHVFARNVHLLGQKNNKGLRLQSLSWCEGVKVSEFIFIWQVEVEHIFYLSVCCCELCPVMDIVKNNETL